MNNFSPMSEDNTPRPHQRFFGDAAQRPAEPSHEETPEPLPDFKPNPLPGADEPAEEMPPKPEPKPEDAPMPPVPPAPEPGDEMEVLPEEPKPARGERDENYYNITHEHLIRTRKERNAIILKIDKLEDERIEKGSKEFDDAAREIGELHNDLWHKNNLIEALVKVLISLD